VYHLKKEKERKAKEVKGSINITHIKELEKEGKRKSVCKEKKTLEKEVGSKTHKAREENGTKTRKSKGRN